LPIWKCDPEPRSLSNRACYLDRPFEPVNAVGQTDERRATFRVGPSAAVVTDEDLEDVVTYCDGYLHRAVVCMFREFVSASETT
jgi:hypothetical protein